MQIEIIEIDEKFLKCLNCDKTFTKIRRKTHIRWWHPKKLPENIIVDEKNNLYCNLCKRKITRQGWTDHNPILHPELEPKKRNKKSDPNEGKLLNFIS